MLAFVPVKKHITNHRELVWQAGRSKLNEIHDFTFHLEAGVAGRTPPLQQMVIG